MKLDENRLYWIDAVRSFACLCVLIMHAYIPGGTNGRALVAPINYYSVAGASILFFMISGALVLYKPKPFFPFIKQRLLRIVLPMVIWTLIAMLIGTFTGRMTWSQFWTGVMLIPFGPQFGTYWFIYVIFGIYLVTPCIATWLEKCSRWELLTLLGVGALALSASYLVMIDKGFGVIVSKNYGYAYYLNGYLWLAVMGYYLRKYVNIGRYRWWHYLIFAILVALPAGYFFWRVPPVLSTHRLSINMVLLCCCYFVIIKHLRLSDRMKRIVYNFAQHSFGIYLVHKLLMNFVLQPLLPETFSLHYAFVYPMVVAFELIPSYIIVHLLSKLPGSKYFVGL